jgi:hypothetical protein
MILAKGNVQLISVKNKVQLILLLRQKAMMWRKQEALLVYYAIVYPKEMLHCMQWILIM